MKIHAQSVRREHCPLRRPYSIAFRHIDAVDLLVVELRGERGLVGLGAASPEPQVTGESFEQCATALEGGRLDWLLGADLRDYVGLGRELVRRLPDLPAARAAVDMALHDLLGRALDRPLADLLGRVHRGLPTSVTLGILPLADTLAQAAEHLAAGFRVLKIKLGRDPEGDLARLRALRRRFGPALKLRVDPNQGYELEHLRALLAEMDALGIEFVEQPLPAADWQRLRSLEPRARARIALDESLLGPADALRLAGDPPACGIFNIKLMKCGGIAPALRIAEIAETAGLELMWGCMDESVISISAALHAALACPATRYLDLDGSFDLARDPAAGGFVLRDGLLGTNGQPGLGVSLRDA